jgi:EmrB/QacA subfamily drug resistance transporter
VSLLLLCGAQFMLVLDVSVVIVALTAIREDLGFAAADLQWVVSAYALTFGGFLLLGGRAADLLGRRRLFVLGLALFTVASLAAGLSQSATMLVVARAVQGLGGALVSPAALSLVTTLFHDGRERNTALGVWGAVAAGGGAAGVVLGGVLTQALDWRWVFFVNVPIGVLVLLLLPRRITETRGPRTSLDLLGAATVTAALMALVYGLSRAERTGFADGTTLALLGGAAVLLVAFVLVEQRVAAPLVPLGIFRRRTMTGADIVALVLAAEIAALSFFGSLYMQEVLGFTALGTGLAFLPMTVVIAVVSQIGARVVGRTGTKPLLLSGLVVLALGLTWLARLPDRGSYAVDLLPGFLLVALGVGLGFVASTIAATANIPDDQQGLASGLVNTAQQVGSAVGLAVLATVAAAAGTTASPAQGYRAAFTVGVGLALAGLLVAAVVLRERDCSPQGAARAAAPGEGGDPGDALPCLPGAGVPLPVVGATVHGPRLIVDPPTQKHPAATTSSGPSA